jgi:methionyl-tRNA formyltransferase
VSDPSNPAPPPSVRSLRLGFAGTPDFAATILKALMRAGRTPAVVYTQPDRPAGRGRKLHPSPVKVLALEHGLPLQQPASLRASAEAAAMLAFDLDVLVVAAYGLLLPAAILGVPRAGCVNVHASLLPRWRGAAPVERALLAGDAETGACIMQMDEGLDTGPVYMCRRCAITPTMDAPALEARLAELGSEALLTCLDQWSELKPSPQASAGVTYARKLTRSDAQIEWGQSATHVERQVRALRGRTPPFTEVGQTRVSVLEANVLEKAPASPAGTILAAGPGGIQIACGSGVLNVLRLRLSLGKGQPLAAADAINGYGKLFRVGSRLGSASHSEIRELDSQ